jgi:hypothetical protein
MSKIAFKKGQRVIIDPGHRDCELFFEQHQGDMGTICNNCEYESDYDSCVVPITWDNGQHNSYRPASIMVISEPEEVSGDITSAEEEISKMFASGAVIRQSTYPSDEIKLPPRPKLSGSPFTATVFDEVATAGWGDVERLPNDPKKHEKPKPADPYELPWFPGTRVKLNPNMSMYNAYIRKTVDGLGYIVNPYMSDSDLKSWKKYPDKSQLSVRVFFDNHYSMDLRLKSLIKVEDAEEKDVARIIFNSGSEFFLIGEASNSDLDKEIISNGQIIYQRYEYNKTWKENIINFIKSH